MMDTWNLWMIQNIANCHELSVPECKQPEDIATKVFVTAIDDRNTQSDCRESCGFHRKPSKRVGISKEKDP